MAKLALHLPQVLDELRAGTMHLTGLFLLARHVTEDNAAALLADARGKSRREIEQLIARWFPRPDIRDSIEPLRPEAEQLALTGAAASATAEQEKPCAGAGSVAPTRPQPLADQALLGDFAAVVDSAVMESGEAHQNQMNQVLSSKNVAASFGRIVFDLLVAQMKAGGLAKEPPSSQRR